MSRPRRVQDLEVPKDIRFQRIEWRVQRVGWAFMGVLVAAAVAGAFGSGPLSHARLDSADGNMTVEYQRLARQKSPTELRITVNRGAERGQPLELTFNQAYIEGQEIQSITPEPSGAQAGGGRITFRFQVSAPREPATVVFLLAPQRPWRYRGEIHGPQGGSAVLTQWVYP
jgi:hypothetical protein